MIARTPSFDQLHDLSAFLKSFVAHADLDECKKTLRGFEDVGDCEMLSTMISADRIIGRYPQKQIIRILAGIVHFWKRTLSYARPDVVIGEVACATEWIALVLARRMEIPYLIPYATPVTNRFFFIDEPAGVWTRMQSDYDERIQNRLTPQEARTAESFVKAFRLNKSKPQFLEWSERSPFNPSLSRLWRRMERIPFRIQSYIESGPYEVGSYHGTPPWRPMWQEILRMCRHVFSESALFEQNIPSEPYIYFPLHVQPEFTTDVRAPSLTNQIAVIENISKSIPITHHVVAKEHPGMRGERKLNYYRQLKSLHNVRLVSPSVDSHELIKRSHAVVTITGSSAWEATLHEKPVIALGPLCYGFCDLIYRCRDIANLSMYVDKALNRYLPNHDLLLKFVWSFLETAYEFQWGDPIRMPHICNPSNVRKAAQAIISEKSHRVVRRQPELVTS